MAYPLSNHEWKRFEPAIEEAIRLNKDPRMRILSKDDITDLVIELNTTAGVEEFLYNMGWSYNQKNDLLKLFQIRLYEQIK